MAGRVQPRAPAPGTGAADTGGLGGRLDTAHGGPGLTFGVDQSGGQINQQDPTCVSIVHADRVGS